MKCLIYEMFDWMLADFVNFKNKVKCLDKKKKKLPNN